MTPKYPEGWVVVVVVVVVMKTYWMALDCSI